MNFYSKLCEKKSCFRTRAISDFFHTEMTIENHKISIVSEKNIKEIGFYANKNKKRTYIKNPVEL
jgi:hypothetical protein